MAGNCESGKKMVGASGFEPRQSKEKQTEKRRVSMLKNAAILLF
jgi:hypothetical protein